jgi:hypothetical protein
MTNNELCELLAHGNLQEAKPIIEDRKQMPESRLRIIGEMLSDYPHVYIEHEPMSESNWYYIWRKENIKGPHDWDRSDCLMQFYWKDGSYNTEGVHSLYDKWGNTL